MVDLPDCTYYQTYLLAGIKNLESYLLSDTLFGHLGLTTPEGQSYPNLTLGGLLLYQKYARALAETAPQQIAAQKINTQIDAQRVRWRVAWAQKAAWEFQSRLRQWGLILAELRDQPSENIPYYRYEVKTRVILALLQPELADIEPIRLEQLERQDAALKILLDLGEFIWDAKLAHAFPKDTHWYLWGLPRER